MNHIGQCLTQSCPMVGPSYDSPRLVGPADCWLPGQLAGRWPISSSRWLPRRVPPVKLVMVMEDSDLPPIPTNEGLISDLLPPFPSISGATMTPGAWHSMFSEMRCGWIGFLKAYKPGPTLILIGLKCRVSATVWKWNLQIDKDVSSPVSKTVFSERWKIDSEGLQWN